MLLSEFDYALPEALIAQRPAQPRDSSRLLLLRRGTGRVSHHLFRELPELLSPGDCVVLNDTRVIPARLQGHTDTPSGRRPVEVLLLRELGKGTSLSWEALIRPGRRLPEGATVEFGESGVRATVTRKSASGAAELAFCGLETGLFEGFLERYGEMPVPPYVACQPSDPSAYQTVYAKRRGSVAAPTAGLHFTGPLLRALLARDILPVYVLLHVGYGTFAPVRTEIVEDHRMEEESYEVTAGAAREINTRRKAGGRVLAVGTTVTRTLETCHCAVHGIVPAVGRSGLFIYPGYRFAAIDSLMTNFHLPGSTPLLLTSAFCGWEELRLAYRKAIAYGYRFYSFGDAMLIL